MRTQFSVFRLFLGLALCLAFPTCVKAQAAFPTTVSPVNIDRAVHIVIGELVRFEPTDEKWNPMVRLGKAVVLVKETLKGPPSGTVSFIAQTWTDPSYRPQQPIRTHQVGMKGIWMVFSSGWALNYGPLPESLRADVLQTLRLLEERTWSDEVHGLKLWAGVLRSGDRGVQPSIFVALRNVSDAPIYYPNEKVSGILTATAKSADLTAQGRIHHLWGRKETIHCNQITPGETIYLQMDTGAALWWEWRFGTPSEPQPLPPGTYQVVVSFQNDRDGYTYEGNSPQRSIPAWKGVLHAPSVELVLDPPENNRLLIRSNTPTGTGASPR